MDVGLVIYGDLEATSGGFRYDRQLVSYLREQGDTVEVISLPWRRYSRGLLDGFSPSVRATLDRSVDVLIQDELCHPSLLAHNRRLSRPQAVVSLVHHLRSDDPTERWRALYRPVERRYLESVDAMIATSEFTQSRAAAMAPGVKTNPRLVAPPAGRGAGSLSDSAITDRATEGPLRIIFVGNLVPRKDPLTLVSAVAAGVDRGRDWQLTIVGSHDANPAYADRVRTRIEALELTDHVTLMGELSTARLEAAFESSHVCCAPSRYEAFGMVSLEAMEYGVVPIGTTNGGPREFIDHGTNGFLVVPDAPTELTSLLESLDDDRTRLAAMGTRALEAAIAHPGWEETMASVRSFLESVLE